MSSEWFPFLFEGPKVAGGPFAGLGVIICMPQLVDQLLNCRTSRDFVRIQVSFCCIVSFRESSVCMHVLFALAS